MPLSDFLNRRKPAAPATPKPRGGSGRGHSSGYLELEELNVELRHPDGHRVYDRMYRTDADTRQVVQLSVNPILGGTWDVEPYGGQEADEKAIEVAAAVKWALFDYMRPNLIGHLAQFLPVLFRSGFVPGELLWTTAKGPNGKTYIVPKTIALRLPRSVYKWNQKGEDLESIEQFLPIISGATNTGPEGVGYPGAGGDGPGSITLQRKDLVYYRVGAEGDNWEGVSLLRPAYKHWYLKDRIERIDAIAQEHEAMGIPVLYPPPSATPAQLDAMESILREMRANEKGYVVMPGMKAGGGAPDGSGWLLEIMGFGSGQSGSGSGRDAIPTLNYHTNKIAAAFISEFMRLGHGESGARATAQVQADPFMMSIEALVTLIEQELQDSIVIPFVAYNFADVENPPRLRMSLVDQTSLSQLADFVLKLTQVGALLPDQELEEFLRARADMPPPNPKSVQERGEDEEMIRRMIVGGNINPTPADEIAAKQAEEMAKLAPPGGGPAGPAKPKGPSNAKDPYGSNAKVGKHKHGKPAGAPTRSGAAKGRGGAGGGAPRGPGKELSYGDVVTLNANARYWELPVDLDGIETTLDEAPAWVDSATADVYLGMAHEMVDPASPLGQTLGGDSRTQLERQIEIALNDLYDEGGAHVLAELEAQGFVPDATQLDRGARDRGGALRERALLAAEQVELSMRGALLGVERGTGDVGLAKARAERAGRAAVKRIGHDHGVAAFLHGRHDKGKLLDESNASVKARYSATLDRGTCGPCDEADDGVARDLTDPVRLSHQPPNPMCDSLASGENRCRCIEVYEFDPDADFQLSAAAAHTLSTTEMPEYLQRVLTVLIARGMPELRALAVGIRIARQVAETGNLRWPGLRHVGAGNRAEAQEAVDWADRTIVG